MASKENLLSQRLVGVMAVATAVAILGEHLESPFLMYGGICVALVAFVADMAMTLFTHFPPHDNPGPPGGENPNPGPESPGPGGQFHKPSVDFAIQHAQSRRLPVGQELNYPEAN